jgi:hypothetical protein
MATKKKRKKVTLSRRAANNEVKGAKRAPKKETPKKLIAKKTRESTSRKSTATERRPRRKTTRIYTHKEGATFGPETAGLRTGGQSGDLQGLRDIENADSESVDELLEEGNAFEADVVTGVERAEDDEEREVRTHEVPEDDVPEEYRDKDS